MGDACDCYEYWSKYQCCVDLRDVQGRNVDLADCISYTNSTDCNNANCYWNTQGLPPPGVCTVDICLADADFSGRISGADLTVLKKDLGRVSCPCGSDSDDLCQKYFDKYTCCVDLSNAGSNVDIGVCAGYTNSTSCADTDCYWNTQGLPAPGVCTVDICRADNDFSGRITGSDLTVLKKELGRVSCPCNP